MCILTRVKNGWNAFWGFAKPEFHKHYNIENNFDFEAQNTRIEEVITENVKLRAENKRLNEQLKKAVDRNTHLETTLDNYATIFEIMLTYVTDDTARRRISAILTESRLNKTSLR